jgi:hypothetical protein
VLPELASELEGYTMTKERPALAGRPSGAQDPRQEALAFLFGSVVVALLINTVASVLR